jgi:glycosyltransferase involved in cell wall biosynthesis
MLKRLRKSCKARPRKRLLYWPRMKILLISGSRIVGGAERATLQLGQALLARGHRVEAACPDAPRWAALLTGAGIPVHRATLGGSLNLRAPFAIAAAFLRMRPDVALVTTSDEWVWSSLIPRRAAGPRLVLVRHMALPLPLRVRRLAGRRADAIVAVSASVRQSLLADSAIAPARVHVIPNAVRFLPRQDVPDSAERICARARLGLPAAGRWIGFLGGINLGKGIEDVIAAAHRAQPRIGDVNLMVCGRIDHRRETPSYTELARRHGMDGRVYYLGELDDVIPAIVGSDVVAISTHLALREGLAQTAIDAMACGTPIAAYALGGVTDVVGDSDPAALLACPDDVAELGAALVRLLEDSDLAASTAKRGLTRARSEFEPAIMVDRYERLFKDLMRGKARMS